MEQVLNADNNPAFPKDIPFVNITFIYYSYTSTTFFVKQYADISPIQPPPTITTFFSF